MGDGSTDEQMIALVLDALEVGDTVYNPAADWSAALLALGAEARVIGAAGRRAVALSDFNSFCAWA